MEAFYRIGQVMTMLNVSRTKLYQLEHMKKIKPLKSISGQRRYSAKELLKIARLLGIRSSLVRVSPSTAIRIS